MFGKLETEEEETGIPVLVDSGDEEEFPPPPQPSSHGECKSGCGCRKRMGRFNWKKGVTFRYGDGSIREIQQFDDEGSWICPVSKGNEEVSAGNLKLEFQVAEVKNR